MTPNIFALSIEAVGTLLYAAILWQLTRLISGRFLRYWMFSWLALAASLGGLLANQVIDLPHGLNQLALSVYTVGQYLFAVLLWVGFRQLNTGQLLSRSDARVIAPLLIVGAVMPILFPGFAALFPIHGIVLAILILLILHQTRGYHIPAGRPAIGLRLVRVSLAILAIVFAHHAPAIYWAQIQKVDLWSYMMTWPVYGAVVEVALAFGMVVLACEQVQYELEEKNLQLAEATTQLAHAASTDALTGLGNRRAFDQLVMQSQDTPFCGVMAVIDLNDLKRLNDRYLHQAGDAALQSVARAIRMKFRVTDPLFRVGGDEFLVILPNGSEDELTARMTAIDQQLARQRLPNLDEPICLSIAWGIASFLNAAELTTAYHKADQLMYTQKNQRKQSRECSTAT